MRLIDADDLKKTYYRELNVEPGETGACYIAFGMLPRMIDNARTINIEKPKRGHWHITDAYPHNVYCSECYTRFAQTHWAVWEDGSLPRNYCPNCGAKMEDEDEAD